MSFTFWSRLLWAPRAAFWDKFALRTRVFWVDFWFPRICASSSACKRSVRSHSSDIFAHPDSPLFLHFSIKLVNFKLCISNFTFICIVSYSILLNFLLWEFCNLQISGKPEIEQDWYFSRVPRVLEKAGRFSACLFASQVWTCSAIASFRLQWFANYKKLVKFWARNSFLYFLFHLCWILASSCFVDSSPSSLESSEYADRADFERFIFRHWRVVNPW